MSEESVFLKNLSADLKPFADKSDCCTFIVRLRKENKQLQSQLQQKENIIKEAINYIKEESWFCYKDNEEVIDRTPINKLLEILGDNDE